jgi:hypothetical protein
MVDRSDQRLRTVDESGGSTAEDAEAEERATDEGMPENPGGATSEAMGRPPGTGRGPIPPTDAGPHGPVTVDDLEEDDGGYDLGGEA